MAIAPCLLLKPVFYLWGTTGIVLLLAGSCLLFLAARRFSRTLETRADSFGRAHETDPGTYARALAAIHEDNLIPAVMARKTTHPDLYDRLVSIGSPPEYPRPKKPSSFSWQTMVLAVPLGIFIGGRIVPSHYPTQHPSIVESDESSAADADEMNGPEQRQITNRAPFELKSDSSNRN